VRSYRYQVLASGEERRQMNPMEFQINAGIRHILDWLNNSYSVAPFVELEPLPGNLQLPAGSKLVFEGGDNGPAVIEVPGPTCPTCGEERQVRRFRIVAVEISADGDEL
jgi:hypothetical protein